MPTYVLRFVSPESLSCKEVTEFEDSGVKTRFVLSQDTGGPGAVEQGRHCPAQEGKHSRVLRSRSAEQCLPGGAKLNVEVRQLRALLQLEARTPAQHTLEVQRCF